jgi:hypothetical protein
MPKRSRPKLNPLTIEVQQTIVEVHTKSMEAVRLSRVNYEGNDLVFVDVRVFSRGYDAEGEVYFPTRRGIQMKESDFLKLAQAHAKAAGSEIKGGVVH